MSDIAVLAHLAPVLGTAPSGPTVRRALGMARGTAMLERIARPARRPGRNVWQLIAHTPAGIPLSARRTGLGSRLCWRCFQVLLEAGPYPLFLVSAHPGDERTQQLKGALRPHLA